MPICPIPSTPSRIASSCKAWLVEFCDRHVLRLIKLWLRVPVEERDGEGRRRMVGGKSNKRGTPQGGVISPLLANLYMNRFLKFSADARM